MSAPQGAGSIERDLELYGVAFELDGRRLAPDQVHVRYRKAEAQMSGGVDELVERALSAFHSAAGATPWPDPSYPEYNQNQRERMSAAIAALSAKVRGDTEAGPMDLSAPPMVWLQVDTDGDNEDRSEAIPPEAWDHLSWHYESIGGQEVRYIREDLATLSAQPRMDSGAGDENDVEVWALVELAEKTGAVKDEGEDGVFWTMTLDNFYAMEGQLRYRNVGAGWAAHYAARRPAIAEPASAPVGVEAMSGIRSELAGVIRRDEGEPVWVEPNEAAAILRALAQQPRPDDVARMVEWQPIETAPKSPVDGSRVEGVYLQGFIPDADIVDRDAMVDVIWWEPLLPNNRGGRGKWCANRYGEACEVSPSHWMPLPAAPFTAAQQEAE